MVDLSDPFWAGVRVGSPDECWPHKAPPGSHGYPQVWAPHLMEGCGVTTAPRLAYRLAYGRFAAVTRHRCPAGPDKRCCNPSHLVDGTHGDNARDRILDGTQRRGETNGNAVLTERIVAEARRIYAAAPSPQVVTALALRFSVNRATLWSALSGKSWRHVQPTTDSPDEETAA